MERGQPVLVRVDFNVPLKDGEADTMILGVGPDFLSLFPRDIGEAGRISIEGTLGGTGRGLVLARQVGLYPPGRGEALRRQRFG